MHVIRSHKSDPKKPYFFDFDFFWILPRTIFLIRGTKELHMLNDHIKDCPIFNGSGMGVEQNYSLERRKASRRVLDNSWTTSSTVGLVTVSSL